MNKSQCCRHGYVSDKGTLMDGAESSSEGSDEEEDEEREEEKERRTPQKSREEERQPTPRKAPIKEEEDDLYGGSTDADEPGLHYTRFH
ncbi:hypothetical protein J4Q44_G00018130 [Coregonus suidteri]|uniref:Uncharacterized protein n=1 Tax=Coregonus suidteri TaxID=861788 RepID=A0AAN8MGG2_9TELE